jgi:hypothetical protein
MERHIVKTPKLSKPTISKSNLVCIQSSNYNLIIVLIIACIIVIGFCLYKLYMSPMHYQINKQNVNQNVNVNENVDINPNELPSEFKFDKTYSSISNLNSDMTDIQAMVGRAKMTGMPAIPLDPSMPRIIGMPPLNPVLRPETLPWIQPIRPNLYDRRIDFALLGYISRKHNLMMPLYGRMTRYNSNKYEYYVIDTNTNIKIPVYSKNDNELYTNDEIFVNEKRYKVTIYDMNEIQY